MRQDFNNAALVRSQEFTIDAYQGQDVTLPIGPDIIIPDNFDIDQFRQDPEMWSEMVGHKVIHVDSAFAETLFGAVDDMDQEAYENISGVNIRFSNETPEQLEQRLDEAETSVREAAARYYDAPTLAVFENFTRDEWFDLAKAAQDVYEADHADVFGADYSIIRHAGGSATSLTLENSDNIGLIAVAETDAYQFENWFGESFRDALGISADDIGYDSETVRDLIIAHELEHLTQSRLREMEQATGIDFTNYRELDANMTELLFARDVLEIENPEIYEQLNDLSYLYRHTIGETFGLGANREQFSREFRNDDIASHHNNHHISQYVGGENLTGTSEEIHQASVSLGEKILNQLGFPPPGEGSGPQQVMSYQDRLTHLQEHRDLPSIGQMRTALSDLITNTPEDLSPMKQELAGTYLESMDSLGIQAESYASLLNSRSATLTEQQYMQDHVPPDATEAMAAFAEYLENQDPPAADNVFQP